MNNESKLSEAEQLKMFQVNKEFFAWLNHIEAMGYDRCKRKQVFK